MNNIRLYFYLKMAMLPCGAKRKFYLDCVQQKVKFELFLFNIESSEKHCVVCTVILCHCPENTIFIRITVGKHRIVSR